MIRPDQGVRARGRTLSDGGARAGFYYALSEAHLRRIIRVDLKSELFAHQIDEQALALARTMDGKLLLITGHFNQDDWHWTYNKRVILT